MKRNDRARAGIVWSPALNVAAGEDDVELLLAAAVVVELVVGLDDLDPGRGGAVGVEAEGADAERVPHGQPLVTRAGPRPRRHVVEVQVRDAAHQRAPPTRSAGIDRRGARGAVVRADSPASCRGSNPSKPVRTDTLVTRAMRTPHESLNISVQ